MQKKWKSKHFQTKTILFLFISFRIKAKYKISIVRNQWVQKIIRQIRCGHQFQQITS